MNTSDLPLAHLQSLPPKVGDILTGTVESVSGHSCFLKLPGGHRGRLDLEDSLSHQSRQGLDSLPVYAVGRALQVYVRRVRADPGGVIVFLHERWAHDDPWLGLPDQLEHGNRVTGWVVRTVPGKLGPAVLVQLDTEAPVCDADGHPYEWADGVRTGLVLQPDIQVLIYPEHLPSSQGSTATIDTEVPHEVAPRLPLERHEPVAALMLDTQRRPPHEPTASMLALIHHLDAAKLPGAATGEQPGQPPNADRTARRIAAQAATAGATNAAMALRGKRIGVLDDSASARDALVDVLGNYGATVEALQPATDGTNWSHAALVQCLKEHLAQPYDLLLVDDGLPGVHDGERALREALHWANAQTPPLSVPPRIVLISAHTEHTEWNHARLEALGVYGAMRRPLSPAALAEVLESTGPAHWEWAPPGAAVWDTTRLASAPADALHAVLRQSRTLLQQDYAVLLAVAPHGGLAWLAADGTPPFHARDLPEAARQSRLRELTDGLRQELALAQGNDAVGVLRPTDRHTAWWRGLQPSGDGKPHYLLGVGSPGRDCSALWPLFCQAVDARLEAEQWSRALKQHAPALATGWMAHGHAHETLSLTETLSLQATSLITLLDNAEADGGVVDAQRLAALAGRLSGTSQQIAALGRRLLRRQRDRRRPIHLRDWVEDLKALLKRNCQDARVALRVDDAPDLVLALPEAVLGVAVTNLVLNAVKHHYREDNRWVSVRFWRRVTDDHLVCDVQDNGPGISQTVLAHLFEPGLSTAADTQQRNGIGLWLSRTLLQQEQGRLSLHSNLRGLGCTFRIELPVLAESATPEP